MDKKRKNKLIEALLYALAFVLLVIAFGTRTIKTDTRGKIIDHGEIINSKVIKYQEYIVEEFDMTGQKYYVAKTKKIIQHTHEDGFKWLDVVVE